MPKKRNILNAFETSSIQDFVTTKILLSSLHHDWDGIVFFHIKALPGEVQKHTPLQHVITIPSKIPKDCKVEALTNGAMHSIKPYVGQVIFDPAHTARQYNHSSISEAYSIHLDPLILRDIVSEQFDPNHIELLQKHNQEDQLIFQIGKTIKKELASGYPFREYIDSLKICLAAHIIKNYATQNYNFKQYRGGLSKKKLKNIKDYINDNLSENLSLEILARLAGLSQFYFSRLFKQSTGVSPHQYITRQRINKAKCLLANSNNQISEIALICGFTNQSHLNRYFKRSTGNTPKFYRDSFD